jgi:hypothetical protein
MTNAVWSSPAIQLNTKSYIIVDGGVPCGKDHADDNWTACATNQTGTGIIQNTANGTNLANQVVSQFIGGGSGTSGDTCGSNLEIRNLLLLNAYVEVQNDTSSASGSQTTFLNACGSNLYVHDLTSYYSNVGAGATATSAVTNWDISYCVIEHAHWGVVLDLGSSGGVPTNFRIHDNDINLYADWSASSGVNHLDGLFTWGQTSSNYIKGIYIYNNYLHGDWQQSGQCPTGYMYISEASDNAYIFNNVFYQTGAYSCNGNIAFASEQYAYVYNNTLYSSVQGGQAIGGADPAIVSNAVTIENNIIDTTVYPLMFGSDSQSVFGTVDYNDYYNYSSDWRVGSSWYSWSAWQALTCGTSGCDAHGSIGNPNLASSFPFVLQSGSAAIGLGTNLYSVCNGQPNPGLGALCYDKLGNARPSSGNWDAGAYNYSTTAPQPPTSLTAVAH